MVSTTNLIAYYKFDETSGTTAEDSHGSYDGTASNARIFTTSTTSGKIGNDADFSQGEDTITISSIPLNFGTGDFSYSFWIKTSSSGTHVFWQFSDSWGSTDNHSMYLTGGELHFVTNSDFTLTTASNLDSGSWNHVAVVREGTGTNEFKTYVNGSLVSSSTVANNLSESGLNLILGKRTVDTALAFTGQLDEIGIWSRALTSTEVEELYNSGNGLAYPFTTDVTVTPSAIALSLTNQEAVYSIDVAPVSLGASFNVPTPQILGANRSYISRRAFGTVGSAAIRKDVYYTENNGTPYPGDPYDDFNDTG